jgi:ribosomal protein S18 acetylase RimI-like enzyme
MRRNNYIIRDAQVADAEKLVAYVNHLSEEPDLDIPLGPGEFNLSTYEEEMILTEYAFSDNSLFLVAEAEGRIVGALNCKGGLRRATRHAVILGISIDKDWRGQGIGNALIAEAIEWAKGTGIVKRIELSVYARNETAIHLYEKHGFEIEGRRKRSICRNGEYEDDLIMALIL